MCTTSTYRLMTNSLLSSIGFLMLWGWLPHLQPLAMSNKAWREVTIIVSPNPSSAPPPGKHPIRLFPFGDSNFSALPNLLTNSLFHLCFCTLPIKEEEAHTLFCKFFKAIWCWTIACFSLSFAFADSFERNWDSFNIYTLGNRCWLFRFGCLEKCPIDSRMLRTRHKMDAHVKIIWEKWDEWRVLVPSQTLHDFTRVFQNRKEL